MNIREVRLIWLGHVERTTETVCKPNENMENGIWKWVDT